MSADKEISSQQVFQGRAVNLQVDTIEKSNSGKTTRNTKHEGGYCSRKNRNVQSRQCLP